MIDLGATLAGFSVQLVHGLAVIVVSAVGTVLVLVVVGWGFQRIVRSIWAWFWR